MITEETPDDAEACDDILLTLQKYPANVGLMAITAVFTALWCGDGVKETDVVKAVMKLKKKP